MERVAACPVRRAHSLVWSFAVSYIAIVEPVWPSLHRNPEIPGTPVTSRLPPTQGV
mgnify:CR=1 FL=1